LSGTFSSTGAAQEPADFAGDWVLKVGNRIFLVATLTLAPEGAAHFIGSLVRLQHFSTSGGDSFSNIKGPVVRYPIVSSSARENCLSFTTQSLADKNDKDDFQLCVTRQGRGTLRLDVPGFEPWPVTREQGSLAVVTDWEGTRNYFLNDSDVSSSEMQRIFEEDQKTGNRALERSIGPWLEKQTQPAARSRTSFFWMPNYIPGRTSKELPSCFNMVTRQTTTSWPTRWLWSLYHGDKAAPSG
jgi:hypothetical protein